MTREELLLNTVTRIHEVCIAKVFNPASDDFMHGITGNKICNSDMSKMYYIEQLIGDSIAELAKIPEVSSDSVYREKWRMF